MSIKSVLIATVVGFGTIAGANVASAAPLGAPVVKAEAAVTQVGFHHKSGHHGHHGYNTGYGYGYGHGYGHGYKTHYYAQPYKRCYQEKVRVWSDHYHDWVYTYETVCYNQYH
ncbi:hypothetical protein [Acuticoccus sediminis]|uniref:hypothetical protein n=1 Tax=Acuticoccus sediminis TaxID=2184697 RepID=UPI001CFDF227|nr:hypothetical protein [Acuticoccus sediminis]